MKLAVADWNGRVSPVFDVARNVAVFDIQDGAIVSRHNEPMLSDDLLAKAARLAELGVDTLVCGALSQPLAAVLTSRGVRPIAFIAGTVEEVVEAYLTGRLESAQLAMPGCGGRGRGLGRGLGRGMGRGMRGGMGRGRGRNSTVGELSACVCPQCGTREQHQPGQPCNQRRCPNCGAPMVRG